MEPLDETKTLVERIRSGLLPGHAPESTSEAEAVEGAADVAPSEPDRSGLPNIVPDIHALRPIGFGATGDVYLCREPALRRLVAVKLLDPELGRDVTARARFQREAQSAAGIFHPHVATVYRVGTTADDQPYLVMPHIKGVTLADRLKALGSVDVEEARRILAETASALAAAGHEHNLNADHERSGPASSCG